MSSKRHLRRRSCEGKRRHETPEAARQHIRHLVRGNRVGGGWVESYHCQFCGGYHVGHVPGSMRHQGRQQRGSSRFDYLALAALLVAMGVGSLWWMIELVAIVLMLAGGGI